MKVDMTTDEAYAFYCEIFNPVRELMILAELIGTDDLDKDVMEKYKALKDALEVLDDPDLSKEEKVEKISSMGKEFKEKFKDELQQDTQ